MTNKKKQREYFLIVDSYNQLGLFVAIMGLSSKFREGGLISNNSYFLHIGCFFRFNVAKKFTFIYSINQFHLEERNCRMFSHSVSSVATELILPCLRTSLEVISIGTRYQLPSRAGQVVIID